MIELTFKIEATPENMRAMGRRFMAWADADAMVLGYAPDVPGVDPPPSDSEDRLSHAIMSAGDPTPATPNIIPPPPPVIDPPSAGSSPPLDSPSTQAAEDLETDARGLPWDERIHSSSKAMTKPGDWRTKRGVNPALVAQVEAELKSKLAPVPVRHVDTGACAGVQAPPAAEVQALPPPESFGQMTFALLAKHVADLRTKGEITDEYIEKICTSQGIKGFTMAASLPPDNLRAFYREVYDHVLAPSTEAS